MKLLLISFVITLLSLALLEGNDQHVMQDMVDKATVDRMYKRVELDANYHNPNASYSCKMTATKTLLGKKTKPSACSRRLVAYVLLKNRSLNY